MKEKENNNEIQSETKSKRKQKTIQMPWFTGKIGKIKIK